MAIHKRSIYETEEDLWGAQSSMMTWASSILLAIIFLILLGVSIIWLTVHPQQLHYAVQDALISNLNLTDMRLVTANFKINMSADNPNHRVSFTYKPMKVSVKSQGHTLASTDGPLLFHDKNNYTTFLVKLNNVVLPRSTLSKMKDGEQSVEIKIDVIIEASVRFQPRRWKHDHCRIQIFCSDVVAHSSPVEAFKQTECDVEL